MAISYLHNPNHLIVQVAPKVLMGDNDELFTYGSMRAKFDMTGADLKASALEMWSLTEEKDRYKLETWLGGQEVEIAEDKTLTEMGIKNGAPIKIVAI